MERFHKNAGRIGLALLAAACLAGESAAQRGERLVYNPVTRQSEPELRRDSAERSGLSWQTHPARSPKPQPVRRVATAPQEVPVAEPVIEQAFEEGLEYGVEQAGLLGPVCGCGDAACADGACGDLVGGCGSEICNPPGFFAGFEFTFVKPRFESNLAFTGTDQVVDATGATTDTITETEFDYDLELTPRVYVGLDTGNGVAFRATWWQFDNQANTVSASPEGAGDVIAHPTFGAVNINAVAPDQTLTASSGLDAYSIDLEVIRQTSFCGWDLDVGGGVRYSFSEQEYSASLSDPTGELATIDFSQSIEGIGPTISLGASTPLTRRLSLYSRGRASLLFGDGESTLTATETAPVVVTNQATNRDDVLSIGEVQLGFRWQGRRRRGMLRRPFATFAMEGQVWNGAGTASDDEGTLGFFGFATQIGFDW